MNEEKIIQILPAPENLYVVYNDDNEKFEVKVVCFALLNNGNVIMMDSDDNGFIDEIGVIERVVYK